MQTMPPQRWKQREREEGEIKCEREERHFENENALQMSSGVMNVHSSIPHMNYSVGWGIKHGDRGWGVHMCGCVCECVCQ